MLVWLAFCLLIGSTALYRPAAWQRLFGKRLGAWALDSTGLVMQGVVIPILQTTAIYVLLTQWIPGLQDRLSWGPVASFLLNFVVVDYLYYWNHRLLHTRWLWDWHAVHHTAESMDVFVTSRNTVWTHFLIVYIWVNAFAIFVLADPACYILAASLTAGLDLWRHSEIFPKRGTRLARLLAAVLVTPHEHAWQHSREQTNVNFGANWNFWDRLHGTYVSPEQYPERLGVVLDASLARQLFLPVRVPEMP